MWDERKKTLMEFRKILFAGMAVLLMGRGWALVVAVTLHLYTCLGKSLSLPLKNVHNAHLFFVGISNRVCKAFLK